MTRRFEQTPGQERPLSEDIHQTALVEETMAKIYLYTLADLLLDPANNLDPAKVRSKILGVGFKVATLEQARKLGGILGVEEARAIRLFENLPIQAADRFSFRTLSNEGQQNG